MKSRISLVYVVYVVLLSPFVFASCGSLENDGDKAKELMAARMYPKAIELLKKRIGDKPDDAEAHFQLGVCFMNTGSYGGADERFGNAIRLKSDYGHQIGAEYKRAGTERLNRGSVRQGSLLYRKAVKYDLSLRKQIAQEVLDRAKQGEGDADSLFSLAVSLDGSLKEPEANH